MGNLLFLLVLLSHVAVCHTQGYSMSMRGSSAAIIIGIFSLVFAFTALLFVCAKYCQARHNHGLDLWPDARLGPPPLPIFLDDEPRLSGIDKSLLDLLPSFRFSQLTGSRAGLECAICMAQFEDEETLRLLPKCRHAFHQVCVDHWLSAHSTCPLCRTRVTAEDVAAFRAQPGLTGLAREPPHRVKFSRVGIGNRWSDLTPADLVSLETEISGISQARALPDRAMSDIGRLSRARDGGGGDNDAAASRWRPLARRTMQWFAGKEKGVLPVNG